MFKLKLFIAAVFISVQLVSQEIPLKYPVQPVSPDPNQQFSILHFEAIGKDKFSIVYFQTIYASVITGNEVMQDTGSYVFTDKLKKNIVPNSESATLLIKQIIEAGGKSTTEQVWVLANRKMESSGEYKLYLRKGFKHPIIKSNIPVQFTMHNLDNVKGLTNFEYEALVEQKNRMFPKQEAVVQNQTQGGYKRPTIADDINRTRDQFKSLKGLNIRGDLPKGENVLTRYPMKTDRTFVITKSGKNPLLLKFYVSEDLKTYDVLDSSSVTGSVDLTSVASVYDKNANVIGSVANLVNKTKTDAGEDLAQQTTYALDADYKISGWKHSTGKNKLNSLNPEICWYIGDRLMVLSTNNEKFFKTYYQLHSFEKNKPAVLMYPKTEEEKGSEKSIYAKAYQPEQPIGTGAAPMSQKKIALGFTNVRGTQYIFLEGMRKDETTKVDQYLSLDIIRIEADGKVTNLDQFPGYISNTPVPIIPLVENLDHSYYMVNYPNKLQIRFDKDKSEITPMTSSTEMLETQMDGQQVVKNEFGSVILKRSTAGTAYTLYFYPEID